LTPKFGTVSLAFEAYRLQCQKFWAISHLAWLLETGELIAKRTQLTREDIVACLQFAADRNRRS